MPLVIAVSLLKGGASKTTTSLALAEAAGLSVPTVVLDSDPMGSAIRWAELAAASGQPLRSRVLSRPAPDLAQHLRSDARHAAVVVIDCPPGRLDIIRAALDISGQLVMPVPPGAADVDRVMATSALAAERNLPAVAVLVQVRGAVEDAAVAAVTLKSWGIPVAATQMPLAVAIQRAYGLPVTGRLLRFGADLLTELTKGQLCPENPARISPGSPRYRIRRRT